LKLKCKKNWEFKEKNNDFCYFVVTQYILFVGTYLKHFFIPVLLFSTHDENFHMTLTDKLSKSLQNDVHNAYSRIKNKVSVWTIPVEE